MVRCLFYIASCNLIKKVLSGQYSLRCVYGSEARFNKMVSLYPVESCIFILFKARQSKHDGDIFFIFYDSKIKQPCFIILGELILYTADPLIVPV